MDGEQTDKIMELIESGKTQGAKLLAGGKRIGDDKSNFVEPTVFADVQDDMRIAQEEVGGRKRRESVGEAEKEDFMFDHAVLQTLQQLTHIIFNKL